MQVPSATAATSLIPPNGQDSARIAEQYGTDDPWQIKLIWRCELEAAECDGCTGECRKRNNRYHVPREVNTRFGWQRDNPLCHYGYERFCDANSRLSQIPGKYIGKKFADYVVTAENQRAVKLARAFCERRPNQGLYLYGACGCGKTMLASIIAREFIRDYRNVQFADVPDLLNELKRTFGNPNQSAQGVLDMYFGLDLLILDDFGVGKISDWNLDVMYQLLNTRYNSSRPTIVTSNYSLEELPQRLRTAQDDMTGRRIASRLSEMCVSVSLGNVDWRLRR